MKLTFASHRRYWLAVQGDGSGGMEAGGGTHVAQTLTLTLLFSGGKRRTGPQRVSSK